MESRTFRLVAYCLTQLRHSVPRVAKTEKNNLEHFVSSWLGGRGGGGATETDGKILETFGKDSLSCPQVFRWNKAFVNGRETVEDEPHSGRPTFVRTSKNFESVKDFIRQDRLLTIRKITDELNINERTVKQIVTQNLKFRKVCAKMFQKFE
jgi:hypothetical protein